MAPPLPTRPTLSLVLSSISKELAGLCLCECKSDRKHQSAAHTAAQSEYASISSCGPSFNGLIVIRLCRSPSIHFAFILKKKKKEEVGWQVEASLSHKHSRVHIDLSSFCRLKRAHPDSGCMLGVPPHTPKHSEHARSRPSSSRR